MGDLNQLLEEILVKVSHIDMYKGADDGLYYIEFTAEDPPREFHSIDGVTLMEAAVKSRKALYR